MTAKPPGKQTLSLVILYKVLNTEELAVKMLEKLKEQLEERETSLRLTTARSHHHLWGRKWRYQSQELRHLGASGTVEETEPLLETRVKQRGRKYPASPFLPPYNLLPVTPIDQTEDKSHLAKEPGKCSLFGSAHCSGAGGGWGDKMAGPGAERRQITGEGLRRKSHSLLHLLGGPIFSQTLHEILHRSWSFSRHSQAGRTFWSTR